ncbi:MAG: alpha/beta hydrolase, partial [Pyrinomonadaceae bacterium]|nr:alpha/beta hydrolase [Pyrinomonadaceae bacterium]
MNKKNLALGIGGAIGAIIGVKMLTRARSVDWKTVSDKVQHAENSHFAEVDGATVHFQEFGEQTNPTVFLIHGYTASTYIWNTTAPLLAAQNFHVVAVDLVGFGYSDKPASFDYTIAAQARMIERLMNRLGIGKATMIGSSYGGAVAATLALDYA